MLIAATAAGERNISGGPRGHAMIIDQNAVECLCIVPVIDSEIDDWENMAR